MTKELAAAATFPSADFRVAVPLKPPKKSHKGSGATLLTYSEEFVEVKVGLKKCLEEFLENPEFLRISWRTEAKKDRIAGEKTPMREIDGLKEKIKYLIFRYFI